MAPPSRHTGGLPASIIARKADMHADSRQPGKLPWAQVTTNLIRGDERLPVQQLLQRMHVYCIEKQDTRVGPPVHEIQGLR
jgi:hypothetical protein